MAANAGHITLTGIEKVMNNLNKELVAMRGKTFQGLIKAAILVRRDMEKGSPKTPVDTSNLRHSFFITTVNTSLSTPSFKGDDAGKMASEHNNTIAEAQGITKTEKSPVLIMGYSAYYAVYVHEMINPIVKWNREGSGPKWFELSLEKNMIEMLRIIAKNCKIN